jgi:acetolactate synthase-1/2/3 large subunit
MNSTRIAELLVRKGVTQAFGIIGSSNAWLFDAFKKAGINLTGLHHEQACVMAASGYFKTTHVPAVIIVAAGGGATNAVTGVASMWADSTPGMILSGQETSGNLENDKLKRMYGMQGVKGHEIVKTITKFSCVFEKLQDVETAWGIMTTGRFGPVWLDIPMDLQTRVTYDDVIPFSSHEEVTTWDFDTSKYQRPVILAGQGVKLSHSEHTFSTIHVPVVTSWSAIDISHPLNFGCPGIYGNRCANKIIQACDLLIILGSRLSYMQTGYDFSKFAPNAKIVMVNIEKSDFKGSVNVKMDCKFAIEHLATKTFYINPWIDECKKLNIDFPKLEETHADNSTWLNSYKFIHDQLSPLLLNEVVVTDMGTALLSGHNTIQLKPGNTMFSSYGLGEMGYGLPASVGAAVSGRRVVCLNCDGSMMMNLQELQTIIAHKLNVKVIIFNNDGYLSIKHTQKMFKCEHTAVDSSTGVKLPNYTKVFQSFGIPVFVEHAENIRPFEAFEEFMRIEGPAMYEVFMDPYQNFSPKVQATKVGDVIIPGTLDNMV